MKLNRKWIMIIALVMSMAMATGGTLAYLTDRDSEVNTFTMGNVDIEVEEEYEKDSPLYPGVEVEKQAGIKNVHNTSDAWVWMTVSVPEKLNPYIELGWLEEAPKPIKLEGTPVKEGYVSYVVKHPDILEAGDSTPMYLQSVTLAPSVDYQNGEYVAVVNGEKAPIGDLSTVDIIVDGYAMQTTNIGSVDAAFNAYYAQWGGLTGGESGVTGGSGEDDTNKIAVNPSNVASIDFTVSGQSFELEGEFGDVTITELGEDSVISFDNAIVGELTIADDAVLEGAATIDTISVTRNSTDPITVTLNEANFTVTGGVEVKNTDGKSILNIKNSRIKAATIYVGEHVNNHRAALAELNIVNSYVSCEENNLGSTISVWGRSGVKATIYDSEIYTYSRGWHQSEDANDNSITFQGATSIDVDIQRSNMHLYGARSIINARQYGAEATTVTTNIDDSLIWVVTKSSHGENTLPVWGFDENDINNSILLFTKNTHQNTPAVFKSFVYGNPTIHGDYHVTTQCECDAPIALEDGQTVTFASDANVSIYNDAPGKVEFVKNGSATVVLENGAVVENIDGIN